MKIGRSSRVFRNYCLDCGTRIDGASEVGGDGSPSPGDATVCAYCGHLMVFDGTMRVRNPTDEEITRLAADPRLIAVQKARARIPALKRRGH